MTANKLTDEMKYRLAAGRCKRIMRESGDLGLTHGTRRVHFNLDNVWSANEGAWIFSFGVFFSAHIVAFGHLEDALEDAAAMLADVVPCAFVEPDYAAAMGDAGQSLGDEPNEEAREAAEADLTYTESGWLASYEWTCREVTPEEIVAFCRNEG